MAYYSSLAENVVDGDKIELPDRLSSKVPSSAPEDASSDNDSSEAVSKRNMLYTENFTDAVQLPVHYAGVVDTGTVDNVERLVNTSHESTGTRSSHREPENVSIGSLDDEKLLSVCDGGIDALAMAHYRDDLDARELSSESASVDVSFGDWRSQRVSKSSNTAAELNPENEDYKNGMINYATEEDTDSSWDDDEDLSSFSTAERVVNAEETSVMDGNDGSQAEIATDRPPFPLRTTAMQKFLKRDGQQMASQPQSSESITNSDSVLYEAPYVEHYSPCAVNFTHEAPDQTLRPTAVQEDFNSPSMRELGSCIETVGSEPAESETELQGQCVPNAHGSLSLSMKRLDILPTPEYGREEDQGQPPFKDPGARKGLGPVASLQEDGMLWKIDSTGLETPELTSQKVDHIHQLNPNREESPSRSSVSLKWEGKGTSIHSRSSTEDERAYGMESDMVSGPEKDPLREGSQGSMRRSFPMKEGIDGSILRSRDPPVRVPQQALTGTNQRSWEPGMSRRTTRSRPSMERVPIQGPLMGEGKVHTEKRSFDSEDSGWTGPIDYLPNSYGSASDASSRASPSHGSALTIPHEAGLSLMSQAHQCISPACSVCIQQQNFLPHSQVHQTMMSHQRGAGADQASAANQPMQGLMRSNRMSRQPDSILPTAESSIQNKPPIQHNDLNMLERRMKHHPPLPGKGAPPYVLCRNCEELLQVPEYLSDISGFVQKLHCGGCGGISKFSIPQAGSHISRSSKTTSDWDGCFKMENQSSSVISPAQNSLGKVRPTSDQGVRHKGTSYSSANGKSLVRPDVAGHRHQIKPLAVSTGSGLSDHGSRQFNEKHASNDTDPYNEDYFPSSTSSAPSASPRRFPRLSQDSKQAQAQALAPAFATQRAARDQKLGLDPNSQTVLHRQGRSSSEAASVIQKRAGESWSRGPQGSVPKPFGDSPRYPGLDRYAKDPRPGNWRNDPADRNYSGLNSPRSQVEQPKKIVVAAGSSMFEDLPSALQRQPQKSSGNGSSSGPRSPKLESRLSPAHDPYTYSDAGGRSFDDDDPRLPLKDSTKGAMSFTGSLKRSINDRREEGQGENHRKVIVNGYLISEAAVQKAEERAGPIQSGTYWYDHKAGFWGVLGGPCLGIVLPRIEEFHFPLARDCASGSTGILVNGRELHDKDLEVLAKRGLSTSPGRAYILDINGALFDDVLGQPLKGLGKLAPSIEKRGRGFGMSPLMPMG